MLEINLKRYNYKMKIIISLVGNIRESVKILDLKESINFLIRQFKDYDFQIIIFTWKNNYFNLKEELRNLVEIKEYNPLDNLDTYQKINNFSNKDKNKILKIMEKNNGKKEEKSFQRGSPGGFINAYNMYYLRKKCVKYINENYPDSYLFLLRSDCRWDFKNRINKWIENKFYHAANLRTWREGDEDSKKESRKNGCYNKPHLPISDQHSIGNTSILYKFYNMEDNEISNLFARCHNIESSMDLRLKDLKIERKIQKVTQTDFYLFSS